jgi:hypothetical protein
MSVQYANRGVVANGLELYYNQDYVKSFRGEATTNLVSAGYESFESSVVSYNTSATFNAVRSADKSVFGDYSLLCTRGTGATDAYADMEGYIAVSANTTYTLSSYVYLNDINVSFNLLRPVYFNNTSYLGETQVGIANDNALTSADLGTWKRKWITFTTPATCNNVVARYNMDQAANFFPISFYADGRQLEQKSYPTPFVSGSRNNTVTGTGGLIDISANKNNCDLTGSSLVFNVSGFYSTGSGSLVIDIPDNSTGLKSLSNNSHTYEAWFKLLGAKAGGEVGYFFGRQGPAGQYNQGLFQGAVGDGSFFGGAVWYSSNEAKLITYDGNLNTWYNAAYIVDVEQSQVKLYVNGDLVNSSSLTGSIKQYTDENYYLLGAFTGYVSNCFVDQARAYSRALTEAEVKQNYQATKSAYGYV